MVTINFELDKRRRKKSGLYPLKLRIIYRRRLFRYRTYIDLSTEDHSLLCSDNIDEGLMCVRQKMADLEMKARMILKTMPAFNHLVFKDLFHRNIYVGDEVFSDYRCRIAQLEKEASLGNAAVYSSSMRSLMDYTKKPSLFYQQVTVDFLRDYETWMLSRGRSLTSVGIYLRPLRHQFNEAVRRKSISPDLYPFGRRDYVIPNPRGRKKALALREIKQIFDYRPAEGSREHYLRDLWLFSYLCNGINMKDLCLLRYRDISGDHIHFRRSKTQKTSRSGKPVDVILLEEAKDIIGRWGTNPQKPGSYIFPVLAVDLAPADIRRRIQTLIRQVNNAIQCIGRKLNIRSHLTTYTARHSFATVLKRSGVCVSYISDALGHANVATTESYLDGFEDAAKRTFARKLVNWN